MAVTKTARSRSPDLHNSVIVACRASTRRALLPGVLSVSKHPGTQEEHVKHAEGIMQILEAFDLTKSLRVAGELAGTPPTTATAGSPRALTPWPRRPA